MRKGGPWPLLAAVLMVVLAPALVGAQVHAAPGPVEQTGQTTSVFPGDDGERQAGVTLPTPRFVDNLDGTVTDTLTGLIWLRNANCFGFRTWYQAVEDVNALSSGSCGLGDGSSAGAWRLPNVKELQSLIHFGFVNPSVSDGFGGDRATVGPVCSDIGDPFPGLEPAGYWSSTTTAGSAEVALRVRLNTGAITPIAKDTTDLVWAVRDGPVETAPAPVERTGQVQSYFAGDDGAFRAGVPLPVPRFVDNQNGTVTDRLTGLVWLKDANCFGPRDWSAAMAAANSLVSGSCGLTDGSVPGDWRMPNIKELESLVHWAFANPTLSNAAGLARWREGDAFSRVQSAAYWSSTSHSQIPISAWHLRMSNSSVGIVIKDALGYTWPVRGPVQ
jgi:hypothetical protein